MPTVKNPFITSLLENPQNVQHMCNDILRMGFSTFLAGDGIEDSIINPFINIQAYKSAGDTHLIAHYRNDNNEADSTLLLLNQVNQVEFDVLEYYYDPFIKQEVCNSHNIKINTIQDWTNTIAKYLQLRNYKKLGVSLDFRSYNRTLFSFSYNY